eukprot:CAMPEP_0197743162 /NCGR_PEP_ID=MMETSP1435-20131217/34074_1 /TAXON_ID=426625 /ORGANISM="Chaetoceros brevis, Strain CCMP164" /LENGTH=37 /DNA_ID= /DNA_START= /DNA_END= /DNA_ORIENTATION=
MEAEASATSGVIEWTHCPKMAAMRTAMLRIVSAKTCV